MSITHHVTRLGAAALVCWGSVTLAPAATADPGNGQPQGPLQGQPPVQAQGQPAANGGRGHATPSSSQDHAQGKPATPGKPGGASASHADPGKGGPGRGGTGSGNGGRPATSGDPAGNNGTVKIAPLGDVDGVPDNSPHVGCSFLVEWYGFDEGDTVVSTVSFAEQAPTTGVGMTVDGPSQVFVGGDPASGAGTATGLDGRQQYTLSFTGAPHPQQGYHVKLTVHTPGSIGNDSKTKVFWVEGCATPSATTVPTPAPALGDTTAPSTSTTPASENTQLAPQAEQAAEVLGVQAFGAEVAPSNARSQAGSQVGIQAASQVQALPTAVDAGAAGDPADSQDPAGGALLGMLLLVLGVVAGRLGWIRARG